MTHTHDLMTAPGTAAPDSPNAAAVYDPVAAGYDRARRADPHLVRAFKQQLGEPRERAYLDLGCGTGNYTIAMAAAGFATVGVDPSSMMLRVAAGKSSTIEWVQAPAEALPFEGDVFAGAFTCLAIHHFGDLQCAFDEVYRVMAEGRFVIFTADPEQSERYWLNDYFPRTLADGRRGLPPLDRLADRLTRSGFRHIDTEPFFIPKDMTDWFLYGGKYQPEIYLRDEVRTAITRFRDHGHADEIRSGCERLATDIASGQIWERVRASESDRGDYVFITAQKSATRE